MEKDEYILELKQKPKVDMGGCSGCLGRNGDIRNYNVICPFPHMTTLYKSHVCTCSRKKYNW